MSRTKRPTENQQLELQWTGSEAEMEPEKLASVAKNAKKSVEKSAVAKEVEKPVKEVEKAKQPAKKSVTGRRKKEQEPATELMKKVAARTMNEKDMAKTFTTEEIEEILRRRAKGDSLTPGEHKAIRDRYRKMKRFAKELEQGNQSRLIAVPSITQNGDFYKLFDFSALYYTYRLANRMGRSANLVRDTDRAAKMHHAVSLVNIDKFVKQFEMFEGKTKVEVTEDGIYIFELKRPLTDDEVGELRLVEETRRERLHNVLKPKAMEPAVFQAILMVVRQVAPRARKLEKQYYSAVGEGMLKDLNGLLARYYDFANGLIDREQAGKEIMALIDNLLAGLTIMSEVRVWNYGIAAAIGENVNELKRLTLKEFGK